MTNHVEEKNYLLVFSPDSEKTLKMLKKKNQEQLLQKIESLIVDIVTNPREGTGRPERLKGYGNLEVWSRRINQKDRIVYQIKEDILEIYLLSLIGHYDDK